MGFGKIFKRIFNAVVSVVNRAIDPIQKAVSDASNWLGERAQDIRNDVEAVVNNIANQVENILNKIEEEMERIGDQISAEVQRELSDLVDSINSLGSQFDDLVLQNFRDELKNDFDYLANIMQSVATNGGNALNGVLRGDLSAIEDSLRQTGKDFEDSSKERLREYDDQLHEIGRDLDDGVHAVVEPFVEALQYVRDDVIKPAWHEYRNALEEAAKTVEDEVIRPAIDRAIAAIDEVVATVEPSEFEEQYLRAKAAIDDAVDTMQEARDDVRESLKNVEDELKKAGHMIDDMKVQIIEMAAVIAVGFVPGFGPLLAIALQTAIAELEGQQSLFDELAAGDFSHLDKVIIAVAIAVAPGGAEIKTASEALKAIAKALELSEKMMQAVEQASQAYEIYNKVNQFKDAAEALIDGDLKALAIAGLTAAGQEFADYASCEVSGYLENITVGIDLATIISNKELISAVLDGDFDAIKDSALGVIADKAGSYLNGVLPSSLNNILSADDLRGLITEGKIPELEEKAKSFLGNSLNQYLGQVLPDNLKNIISAEELQKVVNGDYSAITKNLENLLATEMGNFAQANLSQEIAQFLTQDDIKALVNGDTDLLKNKLTDALKSEISTYQEQILNNEYFKAAVEFKDQATQRISDVKNYITAAKETAEHYQEFILEYKNEFESSLTDYVENFEGQFELTKAQVTDGLDQIESDFESYSHFFADEFRDEIANQKAAIDNLLFEANQILIEQYVAPIIETQKQVEEKLDDAFSDIQARYDAKLAEVDQIVQSLRSEVEDRIAEVNQVETSIRFEINNARQDLVFLNASANILGKEFYDKLQVLKANISDIENIAKNNLDEIQIIFDQENINEELIQFKSQAQALEQNLINSKINAIVNGTISTINSGAAATYLNSDYLKNIITSHVKDLAQLQNYLDDVGIRGVVTGVAGWLRSSVNIVTGDANDSGVNGTDGKDYIIDNRGNDTVNSGLGDDYVETGEGNDSVTAGAGNDYVYAGTGDDAIGGEDGDDHLYGNDGNDYIDSGKGNDVIDGGAGNDRLFGQDGNDTISGGDGDDAIDGRNDNDSLYGNAGNDAIGGDAGNDLLSGNDGNDYLDGGAGNDVLEGGAGNDSIYGEGSGWDVITNEIGQAGINNFTSNAPVVGDFNGDGKDDLFFKNSDGFNRITYRNSDETWNVVTNEIGQDGINNFTSNAAVVGDFNGDGKDDLFFKNSDGFNSTAYRNNDGTWNVVTNEIGQASINNFTSNAAVVGDFNGDGKDDLFFKNSDGYNRIAYRNDDGTWNVVTNQVGQESINNFTSNAAVAGDFNGDGKDDLFFKNSDGFNRIAYRNDDGTWNVVTNQVGQASINNFTSNAPVVGDFNGDGKDDLFFKNSDGFNRIILGGNGANLETISNTISQAGIGNFGSGNFVSGDFDGNGKDDLFFKNSDGSNATATYLKGDNFNDTISGQAGDDFLVGNVGSDTYIFNIGDGNDTIFDSNSALSENVTTTTDKIIFGSGITKENLIFVKSGNDLTIFFRNTSTDSIKIQDHFNPNLQNRIEQILFASGELIDLVNNFTNYLTSPSAISSIVVGSNNRDVLQGSGGSELFLGNSGQDDIHGGEGDDLILGGNDDDLLLGDAGNDVIYGDEGGDWLYGNEGNDSLYGGNGTDRFVGGSGDDYFDGGADNDAVTYLWSSGAVNINLASGIATGAEGTDRLVSIETAQGSTHNDTITGDEKGNTFFGDAGDDVINGASGTDTIYGNDGNDQIFGGSEDDLLLGDAGNDVIYGDEGDDWLYGNEGNDSLYGGNGTDRFVGGSGDDYFDGGEGLDAVTYLWSSGAVNINLASGITTGAEGTDRFTNIEIVESSSYNDLITGSDGDNIIYAGLGNDVVSGANGNDSIYAGNGDDTIYAGAGNDYIRGDWDADYIDGGDGVDTLDYQDSTSGVDIRLNGATMAERAGMENKGWGGMATYDTVLNIENLTGSNFRDGITGSDAANQLNGLDGDDYLSGLGGDDVLDGGNGNDDLRGGEGDDELNGGAGNDFLSGDLGSDTYTFNNNFGSDVISDADGTIIINDVQLGGHAVRQSNSDEFLLQNYSLKMLGNDLLISDRQNSNNSITVQNFQNNSFGINLNQNPTSSFDSLILSEDSVVDFSLLSQAFDADGDVLKIDSFSNVAHGTIALNKETGVARYAANSNFFGVDSFEYVISDGHGGLVTKTANIVVNSVNDTPDAAADSASGTEDNSVVISFTTILANDSDIEDGAAIQNLNGDDIVFANPTHGTIVVTATGIIYTPNANYYGTDSISYQIKDSAGVLSNVATINLNIASVNDAPTITSIITPSSSINEDVVGVVVSAATIVASFADVDGDSLIYSASLISNGGVVSLPSWLSINSATGEIISTNPSNSDVGNYNLKITATDSSGAFASQDFVLAVNNVNDAPTASLITSSTTEDTNKITLAFSGSDIDVGDSLAYSVLTNPAQGTVVNNGDGTFSFNLGNNFQDLAAGQTRDVAFTYQATDLSGAHSNISTALITITGTNDAPTATITTATTNEDNSIRIDVLSGASDVDNGNILTISSITDGSHGTALIITNAKGKQTISYTPNSNYSGTDQISYTISDGNGGTVTKNLVVTINAVNDAPIIATAISAQSAKAGNSFTYTVPINAFTDIDNDNLTYSARLANGAALPSWLIFDATTQTFVGTPPSGSAAALSVKITASDGSLSATQTFNLNVATNLISGTAGSDTLSGTSSNDEINGNAGNDTIIGGLGADKINGGAGVDTTSYTDSTSAIAVNLTTNVNSGGSATGDILTNIENITGSSYNDTITGNSSVNSIDGGAGNDVITGGLGADKINGGAGVDTASYTDSASAITVNLTTNVNKGGTAAGDVLTNIENIIGSNYNDSITGDVGDNLINGGIGNDVIKGGGGNDRLIGGFEKDTLTGGAGNDIFTFTSLLDSTINNSDLITDFTKGQDQIDFSGLGFESIIKGTSSADESILTYHYEGNNTIIEDHDHTFAVKLTGKIALGNGDFDFS